MSKVIDNVKKIDLNSIQKWYIININKKCFNLIHSDLLA